MGEVAKKITKGTTPHDKSWSGPVNYVKTESIDSNNGNISVIANTSLEEHEGYLKRSQLKENDVLFSIVGTLGRVGVVKKKDLPANTNQQICIIRPFEENSFFLLNALKTNRVKSFIKSDATIGAQPSLSLWQIEGLRIPFPNLEEQQKISAFFVKLDSLIALHQRKLEHLQEQKKGLLQKMFPKNGETVPEVRFPGFTDAWEQRKLGEVATRVTRKNKNLESTLPLTISARLGLVDQISYFDKRIASSNLTNYILLNRGEFAYNKSYSNGYPFGTVKRLNRYDKGVIPSLYIAFMPNTIFINSDFMEMYFETSLWHKEVSARASEGARNHGLLNISPSDFMDIYMKIPEKIEEQKKIAKFLEDFDSLIALHQRKLDHLELMKKGLLQQMFV